MAQTVGLVPTSWENVKGNLASYGVGEAVVRKLLPQGFNHRLPNPVLLVTSNIREGETGEPLGIVESLQKKNTHQIILLKLVPLWVTETDKQIKKKKGVRSIFTDMGLGKGGLPTCSSFQWGRC